MAFMHDNAVDNDWLEGARLWTAIQTRIREIHLPNVKIPVQNFDLLKAILL